LNRNALAGITGRSAGAVAAHRPCAGVSPDSSPARPGPLARSESTRITHTLYATVGTDTGGVWTYQAITFTVT
jgi:hypothetical protein